MLLTLAVLVSLVLAIQRPPLAPEHALRLRPIAVASVVAQFLHFVEELANQFYLRFPELLGLATWPATFFVAFKVSWLVTWSVAIVAITKLPRLCAVALWFLAIASIANGVVHPMLSVLGGGYFPGWWSSVVVGILGIVLIRRLAPATRPFCTMG